MAFNRHLVRAAVVAAIDAPVVAACATAKVYDFPEARWVHRDRVVPMTTTDGAGAEAVTLQAGAKQWTDRWNIDLWVISEMPASGAATAETKVAAMVDAIVTAVMADVTLGGVTSLLHCMVNDIEGPSIEPTDQGYLSVARVTLRCESRHRP